VKNLYILTRTSGRAEFFKACRKSIKALTGFNITHIVHSDDPRNEAYIECDILIRGEAHGSYMGTAPYNLYCNRLLDQVKLMPPGWVHIIDDDDAYCNPEVFTKILEGADFKKHHICKSQRGPNKVYPKAWKQQHTYQTECIIMPSNLAVKGRWWADKSGDHYYTRQITKLAPMEWHDVIICAAQVGKGHGALVDLDGKPLDQSKFYPLEQDVYVKMHVDNKRKRGASLYNVAYAEALILEKHGFGRVTYKGTEVVQCTPKP
jgi:hypothetical protein